MIPESLVYVRRQFEELIEFLESHHRRRNSTGTVSWRLSDPSGESAILWKEVLDQCAHRPSPMSCFDAFINMAPIVTLRGTKEVVDFYREMKSELQERIAQGISAVPGEQVPPPLGQHSHLVQDARAFGSFRLIRRLPRRGHLHQRLGIRRNRDGRIRWRAWPGRTPTFIMNISIDLMVGTDPGV